MLSNLACVLIYLLILFVIEDGFKDSYVLKILKNLHNIPTVHDGVDAQYLES